MKLLFITQKIHGQDAFTVLWAEAFLARGYDVTLLCLEAKPQEVPSVLGRVPDSRLKIVSLGKERGVPPWRWVVRFWCQCLWLPYDRVFIHMTPVWGGVGAPIFWLRRVPVYLWYTHYQSQWGLTVLGWYARRFFCATPQSLPQYNGSQKKVVTGHGIDLHFWPQRQNQSRDPARLVMVHRLARSKRAEIGIRALLELPSSFTLTIYGQEVEPTYAAELRNLVDELGLGQRVEFCGSVPFHGLATIYTAHRFILNFAKETIDKTMLEALTCGCYPITTLQNATAIGLPQAPAQDTPAAAAATIMALFDAPVIPAEALYHIVAERHSLSGIVATMDGYMASGR